VSTYVAGVAVMSIGLGAIAALDVEQDAPEANITGIGDALWWATTTVTTVGYGDRYPVTTEGRIIAVALMLVGVAVVGAVTGSVARMDGRSGCPRRGGVADRRVTPSRFRTRTRARGGASIPAAYSAERGTRPITHGLHTATRNGGGRCTTSRGRNCRSAAVSGTFSGASAPAY
jgi:hypothetical protein